jgi:hypothetical protein
VPTLSADDLGHMFGTGHRHALGHVLGLLGADLVEADADAGQGADEGHQVGGAVRLGDGVHRLAEAEHGELEGELEGAFVADAARAVDVGEEARRRHCTRRRHGPGAVDCRRLSGGPSDAVPTFIRHINDARYSSKNDHSYKNILSNMLSLQGSN